MKRYYQCTGCKEVIEGSPAVVLPGLYLCTSCASHYEAHAKRLWGRMQRGTASEFKHVKRCTGCGWLLHKSRFAPGADQCITCCKKKEPVMEAESTNGAASSFGGVCDVCLCVYDHRGIRTQPLSEAQYSVLLSVRSESKSRGMCKTCFTVEGTVVALHKERDDNRVTGCHSKDDDYTERGSSGEEGGIQ